MTYERREGGRPDHRDSVGGFGDEVVVLDEIEQSDERLDGLGGAELA